MKSRVILFGIGFLLLIGAASGYTYWHEQQRLRPILAQQQAGNAASSAQFRARLQEIGQQVRDGNITEQQAQQLRLQAMREANARGQQHFQQAVNQIVSDQ